MTEEAFTCPACGADFTVRERLDEDEPARPTHEEPDATRAEAEDSVSCPNCGSRVERAEGDRGGGRPG